MKTRLEETPINLAEDVDCKMLLEKLEQEKSRQGKFGLRKSQVSRRSIRGYVLPLRDINGILMKILQYWQVFARSVRRTKRLDEAPMKKRDIALEKTQSDGMVSPHSASFGLIWIIFIEIIRTRKLKKTNIKLYFIQHESGSPPLSESDVSTKINGKRWYSNSISKKILVIHYIK